MEVYMKWKDSITEEVLKKAEKELGETPEIKAKSLVEIRQLINDDEGFHPVMEDWFLIIFLRNKKYNVMRAFKTLKKFYEFKSMYSGRITDLKPTHFRKIYDLNAFALSPLRNKNGEAVMTIFLNRMCADDVSVYDVLAAAFALSEIGIMQEVTQVCGNALVLELKGITFRGLMKFFAPSIASLTLKCLQDRWPYRVNSFHVVNQPSYFNVAFDLIKWMMSKKLRDRVHIHGDNLKSLHDFIPPDILPKELGGHLSDDIYQEFYNYLYENESIFDILTKYKYNGVTFGETKTDSCKSS